MTRGDALVPLGVLVGAHGLRGELRVKVHNPDSEMLASLPTLTLRQPGQPTRRITVRQAHPHAKGLWLIAIDGCHDRDAAAALRGAELCVAREELPALAAGEHYLIDLVGLEVRLPDGRALGRVQEAIEYPAAHVVRVEVAGGTIEVPLLPPYLVDFRLDEGVLIVDQVEDLDVQPLRSPART